MALKSIYKFSLVSAALILTACTQSMSSWTLVLSHDAEGVVTSGAQKNLVNAIRNGCQIRVAWGARRAADPSRTIEHIAEPLWVSVRDSESVEVQVGDFLINHRVLGEPAADHPRRERFGGTEKAVMWRANLKTDGSFDAVWYYPHNGEFITRIPQRHPMKWFADCPDAPASPLFPAENPVN